MSGYCVVMWMMSAPSQRFLSPVLSHIQSDKLQNSIKLGLGGWVPNEVIRMRKSSGQT